MPILRDDKITGKGAPIHKEGQPAAIAAAVPILCIFSPIPL